MKSNIIYQTSIKHSTNAVEISENRFFGGKRKRQCRFLKFKFPNLASTGESETSRVIPIEVPICRSKPDSKFRIWLCSLSGSLQFSSIRPSPFTPIALSCFPPRHRPWASAKHGGWCQRWLPTSASRNRRGQETALSPLAKYRLFAPSLPKFHPVPKIVRKAEKGFTPFFGHFSLIFLDFR